MTAPVEATPPAQPAAPAGPPANPTFVAPPAAPSPADMPPVQPPAPEGKGDPKESDESPDLAKLRKENATWRTKLREQEAASATQQAEREKQAAEMTALRDQMAKVAAIFNPEQPPDPAKLAEQVTAANAERDRVTAEWQQERKALKIQAALPGVLTKANADPGLTEAVLTASGALAKLDPASPTFATDLASAVTEAMEANPRLKVDAPVAQTRKSGAEIPGRSGGSTQLSIEQVRAMKPAELDKARKAGQLTSLGIGPG